MEISAQDRSRRQQMIAAIACAALLLLFGLLCVTAARSKSATVDEPLHLVAGFVHAVSGDFRMDPENPPLFGYIAALLLPRSSLQPAYSSPAWNAIFADHNLHQWDFVTATLQPSAGRFDSLLQRSRLVFVLIGVGLGAAVAWWSWKLAGAAAAIVATTFYALDPNFLAHAGIVKNDVLLCATLTTVALAVWRLGITGHWVCLLSLVLGCVAAVNVKLSGILCGPLVGAMLLARALLPQPWMLLGMNLRSRGRRFLGAGAICLLAAVCCYICVWAFYGWRFFPSPDSTALLDERHLLLSIKARRAADRLHADVLSGDTIEAEPPGLLPSTVLWFESHGLLPQPYLYGILSTHEAELHRPAFLMGQYRDGGWWDYFLLAMLFKSPTALLIAIPVVGAFYIVILVRLRGRLAWDQLWAALCVATPISLYGAVSLVTRLNIGVRHMLPVYPFIFIAIGAAAAVAIRNFPRAATSFAAILLVLLAAESLAAYPDYIAFFNTPSGGARGGLRLLGDSNLDWGQDLKLLARWQQQHADRKLYLCYFGSIDPAWYGVHAAYLPGGWPYPKIPPPFPAPDERCYLAISATHLLGIHYPPEQRRIYWELRKHEPTVVLGGSIYIYEFPMRPAPDAGPGG
jgi:hypothetical protein